MPNLDMEEFPNVARHLLVPVRADGGFEPGLAVDGSNPKPEDYEGGEVVAVYKLHRIVKVEKEGYSG
jgi:hypothetical protein